MAAWLRLSFSTLPSSCGNSRTIQESQLSCGCIGRGWIAIEGAVEDKRTGACVGVPPSLTRAIQLGSDGCVIEAYSLHAAFELWWSKDVHESQLSCACVESNWTATNSGVEEGRNWACECVSPSITRATQLGPDGCVIEAYLLHAAFELWWSKDGSRESARLCVRGRQLNCDQ